MFGNKLIFSIKTDDRHLKDDENTNTKEYSSQDLKFLHLAIK